MLYGRIACLLLLSVLFIGCGPLKTRHAIPNHAVETASLEGYPADIRFWGDVTDSGLREDFAESWRQERDHWLATHPNEPLPDSHYLAISGGGQNGAFGAGLLCGWTARGDRPSFKVVTGISTGALIAPFAFLGADYDDELKTVYTSVNMQDIAVFRNFVDLIRGDSAYNTDPLKRLVDKCFTEEMIDRVADEHRKGRRLLIGTTHLDAQRPVIWDLGAIAGSGHPDRVKLFRMVLLASAAIPGAFAPVYFDVVTPDGEKYDELHVDGGVTRELFVMPSDLKLFELREAMGIHRNSHLYLIRNSKLEPEFASVSPRIGPIAEQSIATLIKAQAMGDIVQLYEEAKLNSMSFRLASIPLDMKDDSKSMFDSRYMTALFDRGYGLAAAGYGWQKTPHDWRTNRPKPAPTTVPSGESKRD